MRFKPGIAKSPIFWQKHGMAKGYWLHYLIGAALVLVAIASLRTAAARTVANYVVLTLLVSAVLLAAGIALAYDWLRGSETAAANPIQGRAETSDGKMTRKLRDSGTNFVGGRL